MVRPTCRANRDKSKDTASDDPNYAYSDPVNKFLGQFLPSNKTAKDGLAGRVDFSQPKLTGRSVQEMVGLDCGQQLLSVHGVSCCAVH